MVELSIIISCGTLAAAVIPEFTKVFTSAHSRHVQEIVAASKEGGASLNILSGLVAGNFSVFWMGLTLAVLLFAAFFFSQQGCHSTWSIRRCSRSAWSRSGCWAWVR